MTFTKNKFLKKVLLRMKSDSSYKKVIKTLLYEKRKGSGNTAYSSLNRIVGGRILDRDNPDQVLPPMISKKMKYQEIFDLLEEKGIIMRKGYFDYEVESECRPYLEGKKNILSPALKKLSDDKKKEIETRIKSEIQKPETYWAINIYSQIEVQMLVTEEINALIDCYETNKPLAMIWRSYKTKIEKMYRGKKNGARKSRTNLHANRTFRRHLEHYDQVLIRNGIISPSDSIRSSVRLGRRIYN